MSRDSERRSERERRKAEQRADVEYETPPSEGKRHRSSPAQYVGEVRSELKRVHWANRRELVSYSLVVLVAVTLMTGYIFGIDAVFRRLVFFIFG